jgi:ubiquinone/menaquinone biosynthesis C-methylase UbiE
MSDFMIDRVLEPEVMDDAAEAREYDAMDHREPNAAFVARLVELGASGRMLDLGTGPGHIPLLVCETIPGARVVGVDLAHHMLAIAGRRRAGSPHAARLAFRHADVKNLPFEDHSFDAVFSNTIMHHLADPRPFLREAARVVRPGGVLLIRDLFRPPDVSTLERLVAEHAAGATPPQQQMLRASLIAALTPDELRALATELELGGVEVVVDSDRHLSLQRAAGVHGTPNGFQHIDLRRAPG